MDDLLKMQALAEQKMKAADHLLKNIYPEVNDPNMLVGISDTIYEAVSSSVMAAASFESQVKRLRSKPTSFIDAVNQLSRLAKRYTFDQPTKSVLYNLHEFMVEKKNAVAKKESMAYQSANVKQKVLVDKKTVRSYLDAAQLVISDIKLKLKDHDG